MNAARARPLVADTHAKTGDDHIHAHERTLGCAHAHAHAARAPNAIALAQQRCTERSLRLTDIRKRVLEALYATHRPLGAYDLIDAVASTGVKRLAPITVYRALDFLVESGFAHRLASRNAYIACPFEHSHDDVVVFLICERCGGVDETQSDALKRALGGIVEREQFMPRSRIIEIAGSCGHCAGSTAQIG